MSLVRNDAELLVALAAAIGAFRTVARDGEKQLRDWLLVRLNESWSDARYQAFCESILTDLEVIRHAIDVQMEDLESGLHRLVERLNAYLETPSLTKSVRGTSRIEVAESSGAHSSGRFEGEINTSERVVKIDPPRPDELCNFRLPQGFVWIPLRQIRLQEELAHVQAVVDYKKVDKETMRLGMIRLRTEVLPCLSDETGLRGSSYFSEMDRASSQSYEHGLQRIYDAFFGESHVQLERGRTADLFGITNGRHRIKLAQELGWDAIPAKAEDASE